MGDFIHYIVLVTIVIWTLDSLLVLNSFTNINISEPESGYEHKNTD